MPIVKLTDKKADVKVDISFNITNGVNTANLIMVSVQHLVILRVVMKRGMLAGKKMQKVTDYIDWYCCLLEKSIRMINQ